MSDFKTQEPGTVAGVELSKIEAIAAGTDGDIADALDGLNRDELEQLLAVELAGSDRKSAITAIQHEIDGRETGDVIQPITYSNAEHPYAHLHASAVDPKQIKFRVLTLDGWVLPADTNLE